MLFGDLAKNGPSFCDDFAVGWDVFSASCMELKRYASLLEGVQASQGA